jgi:hypothetical protein
MVIKINSIKMVNSTKMAIKINLIQMGIKFNSINFKAPIKVNLVHFKAAIKVNSIHFKTAINKNNQVFNQYNLDKLKQIKYNLI